MGLILAGGRSRRMGRDKALIRLAGTTLLDRATRALAPQCAALVVSCGPDEPEWAGAIRHPLIRDALGDHAGPLAGVLAGLDHAAAQWGPAASVVSIPVDTPFVPPDLVSRLRAVRDEGDATVACAASGERRHPVVALWRVAARDRLRDAVVESGLRRVETVLGLFRVAQVTWPDDPLDPFLNLNTPEDLERAERLLAARLPEDRQARDAAGPQ